MVGGRWGGGRRREGEARTLADMDPKGVEVSCEGDGRGAEAGWRKVQGEGPSVG